MENLNKSGISATLCQHCDDVYIGQCCRAVGKRYYEHYTPYHKKEYRKSTPADHMLEKNHEFTGFRLLKEINKPYY